MTIRECLKPAALACLLALTSACGGGGGGGGGGSTPPPGGGNNPPPPPPPPADTKPDAFAFQPVSNLFPEMVVTSEAVTITGIDAPADITVTGGEYAVNDTAFTAVAGQINAGDTVRVRATTATDAEQTVKAVLDIGGVKGEYALSTGPAINFADIDPDPFQLAEPQSVGKGETVTSGVFSVTKINAPAPIVITGGEYRIENGEFTSEPGIVLPGQRVQVRATAPEVDGAAHVATLRIGDVAETFVIVTPPADGQTDTIPDLFGFTPVFDAEPGAEVDSASVTISGLSADAPISIEGGEYAIDGAFTAEPGQAGNGAEISLRVQASPVSGGVRAATVNIGGIPAIFSVTTRAVSPGQDVQPDAYDFDPATSATSGESVESAWVVPVGFDAPSPVIVQGGEYRLDAGAYTSQPRLMLPGQSIRLRGVAPETVGSAQIVTVNIGGETSSFSIFLVDESGENHSPTVDAGPDQVISMDAPEVTLAAVGLDADSDDLTYSWAQTAGPDAAYITTSGDPHDPAATVTFSTHGVYMFEVTVDDGRAQGSDQVQVTVEPSSGGGGPGSPPGVPAGLSATTGDGLITLAWDAVDGATHYIVERKAAADGVYDEIATTAVNGYTDTDVTNGTMYFYVVRAVNDAGESARSAEVSGVPGSGVEICVVNENNSTVAAFPVGAEGNVPPLRRLGNLTGLSDPQAVAYDAVNDEIYVANRALHPFVPAYPIVVFARDANGNMAPKRFIAGTRTGLSEARGIAVDPVNNEVLVSTPGRIQVFAREAHGNVAPLRTLDICVTCAPGIAVDPVHGELFVPVGEEIQVYDRQWVANETPVRTISDGFGESLTPVSVAYDGSNDELVVYYSDAHSILIFDRMNQNSFQKAEIWIHPQAGLTNIRHLAIDGNRGSEGEIFVTSSQGVAVFERVAENTFDTRMPVRLISGTSTGFDQPAGIAVDPADEELFITDANASSLVVHEEAAVGDVPPLRRISGAEAGLRYPTGIATADGRVFVTNVDDSVASYSSPWTGTPLPSSVVQGNSTGFNWTTGIGVSEAANEVFVANLGAATITVHSFDAEGDAAPVRTIAGEATSLSPSAIDVDDVNQEIFVGNNDKSITVYGLTDQANVAPTRSLRPLGSLEYPVAVRVDEANDELLVISTDGQATTKILVFARDAKDGNGPLRKIEGTDTQLFGASGILLDGEEIFVTNAETNAILVFPRVANGNVEPIRIVAGDATMLSQPAGIDYCQ